MQNNNYGSRNKTLFDEWQKSCDKDLFLPEKAKKIGRDDFRQGSFKKVLPHKWLEECIRPYRLHQDFLLLH